MRQTNIPAEVLDLAEIRKAKARRNLLDFIDYCRPGYIRNWHHKVIAEYYQRLLYGDITRLIVSTPPQVGKTELVSRYGVAFALGKDPDKKIILTSYSASLASSLNRDVQRIMSSLEYQEVFPETKIPGIGVKASGSALRNSDLVEVVGRKGSVFSAGIGGSVTGRPLQLGIIDDPVRGRADAESKVVSEAIWRWYSGDFLTRQAPGARIIITQTRWSETDLAGRLLKLQQEDPNADKWTVLSFPAIAEDPVAPYDPRQPGEPLWEWKANLQDLARVRALSEYDWASLYQQRPHNDAFCLFDMDAMRLVAPNQVDLKKCKFYGALDPSMGGKDFAAVVTVATLPDGRWLVWDADLSYDSQSKSMMKIIQKHQQFKYSSFVIESNSLGHAKSAPGDSLFVLELRKEQAKAHVTLPYRLEWHTQNKMDRIRAMQPYFANGQLCFRSDWAAVYPELINQMRLVPDPTAHDDGPDCLHMCIDALVKATKTATAINYSNIRGEQTTPGWQISNHEDEDEDY